MGLMVSRTAHIHVLLRHVVPFCKEFKSGLSPYMEQAHESLHHDFKQVFDRVRRSNIANPTYGSKLLETVNTYNMLQKHQIPRHQMFQNMVLIQMLILVVQDK